MDKEMKIFKVTKRYGLEVDYVVADDVIIDNHSSLLFRVQSQVTNKLEPTYGLAKGEWVGFKRISEKEMLEVEQEEEE